MDDGSAGSQSMAMAPDGELVFGSAHGTVARMNPDGKPDRGFGNDGTVRFTVPGSARTAVNGVAFGAGGQVYAAGAAQIGGRPELFAAAVRG